MVVGSRGGGGLIAGTNRVSEGGDDSGITSWLGDDGRAEVVVESGTSTVGCVAVCDGLERGSGEEPCATTGAGRLAGAVSDAARRRLSVRRDAGRRGGRWRPCPRARRSGSDLVGAPLRSRVDGRVADCPPPGVQGQPRAARIRHVVGQDLVVGPQGPPRVPPSPRSGRIPPRWQTDRGRGRAGTEVD